MFYKIAKYLVIASIIYWLFLGIGILAGWFGLQQTGMFLMLGVLNVGLYIFYATRPERSGNAMVFRLVHYLSLPAAIAGVLVFKGYLDVIQYWKPVNLILITLLYFPLLIIIASTTVNKLFRYFLAVYFLALFILCLLHMARKFENGRLLIILMVAGIIAAIVMVMMSKSKEVSAEATTTDI